MTRALIIGGGIAGPVTAIALQKAGIEAVVHEAYDRTADGVGAFLTLAVNGMDALRSLDLLEAVQGKGFGTPCIALRSGTGRRLAEFAIGGTLEDGTVSQTVKRSDLYGALRDEAVRRGIRVEYGKRLVDAAITPAGGVVARFADGTQAEGDLLIGADGLQSRTRSIIDPAAPSARYTGLLNTGGYARGVRTVDSDPGVFTMVFGRRCFFGYTLAPGGEILWFANPPRAKEPTRAELAAVTAEQWRERLIELFARDATPAAEIVRSSTQIIPAWGTYDFPSVPTWHNERMVIIGDAAHATSPASGQGASMAVEDAIVLAKCLRDIPDIAGAFTAYERLRRGRVERVVAQGKRNGDQKAVGPVSRVIRDLMLPVFLRLQARNGEDPTRWMTGHRIDWDAPVDREDTAA